ncbi:metallophosphoesterase [Gordonia sp. HNM0687]|uniref:Metallophosphoesterase n=1 Tax=Gordonia mangrovi TaxID=2665643 RepID=A0A6L7GIH0_9ACTN|nr:metallophosphoesterase [Gordonia mangrovi]
MAAVLALFLALLTFALHRRLVRATQLARPWSTVADIVLVVFAVLAFIGVGSGAFFDPGWARAPAFLGLAWLAVVFYLLLGVLVIGVLSLVVRLVGRLRGAGRREAVDTMRRRTIQIGSAVVVVASVVTVGYGVVEATRLQVTHTEVAVPDLPEQFDGTRVALIADLHVGPARGRGLVQQVVDEVNAQNPDLVLIAGDLTDGTVAEVGDDLEPLAELSAPLGVFGVSGNHEFYFDDGGAWLDEWERLGISTLRNERTEITVDGATIDLAGVHDETAPAPFEPDLGAALAGRDTNRFVLLLAHEPLQAFGASDAGVDLQVSGHTHGGQMWPIMYLVPLQQPTVQGLDQVEATTVFTSRGAGAWGPPVRVGAPPEISMLQLRTS